MSDTPLSSKQSDIGPLVTALIHAVKMERDEFHERCNNSYSTDALMLCKERVALCKAALLDAMRTAEPPSDALPEQLLDVHAICDERDRLRRELHELRNAPPPSAVDVSAVLRALDRIEEEASCEEVDPDDCRETIIRIAREAIDAAKGRTTVTKDEGQS